MRIINIVSVYRLVTSKANQSSQMTLKGTALQLLNTILVLCSKWLLANYLFESAEIRPYFFLKKIVS